MACESPLLTIQEFCKPVVKLCCHLKLPMVEIFTFTEISKCYKSGPPHQRACLKRGTGELDRNGGQQNHLGNCSKKQNQCGPFPQTLSQSIWGST